MVPAGLLLIAAIRYGQRRLDEAESQPSPTASHRASFRIALIQGNSLAEWKQDPNRERADHGRICRAFGEGRCNGQGRGDGRPIDLVVWPETMFRTGLRIVRRRLSNCRRSRANDGGNRILWAERSGESRAALGTPVLVGIDRGTFPRRPLARTPTPPPQFFNSAVLVDRDGKIVGTYDKVHRVMFGEYIPFADWFPFLYRWTPLTGGINAGEHPVILDVERLASSRRTFATKR